MGLEDDEKRRERRKKDNATTVIAGVNNQLAPNKSGAMDALLEKLKQAGPAQRQKRQRRLDQYKGRNGRTASGTSGRTVSGQSTAGEPTSGGESASPEMPLMPMTLPPIEATEEEDSLTSKSQKMLEDLRKTNSGDAEENGAGSLRVRRRRASGDDRRERRRRQGSNVSASGTDATLEGEDAENQEEMIAKAKLALMNMRRGSEADVEEDAAAGMPTPTTIVSPPSPEPEKAEPVVAAPE